jgi:hypothetical protein
MLRRFLRRHNAPGLVGRHDRRHPYQKKLMLVRCIPPTSVEFLGMSL